MKTVLFPFALAIAAMVQAQDAPIVKPSLPELKLQEAVTVGHSFVLHSSILGEDRTIRIALPKGYAEGHKKYPVLYAMDGQWNFLNSFLTLEAMSSCGQIPEAIVVALHTEKTRTKDLLPAPSSPKGLGGEADRLHSFLKEELIPVVEKHYRTQPFRILTGSSFGGVFVMHAFLKDAPLFQAYLALSPSMWWDGHVLVRRAKDFLKASPGLSSTLYLSIANEGPGMGVDLLAALLKKEAPSGLAWKFDHYPNEVHESIAYKSTGDGLRFVFTGWRRDPVVFESRGDLLKPGDEVQVEMKSPAKLIRYTLDGTDPDLNSVVYEKPLVITKPTVIKAMPVYGNNLRGNSSALTLDILPPLLAETHVPALKSGLSYAYYEGDFERLPDFAKLVPVKSGVAVNFGMEERKKEDGFAMKYMGFLEVPEDVVYTFQLRSDDGSRLRIGDQVIVDNDGLHGDEPKTGKAFLKKGLHRFCLEYFQAAGGRTLKLGYSSSKMSPRDVPFMVFQCPEK